MQHARNSHNVSAHLHPPTPRDFSPRLYVPLRGRLSIKRMYRANKSDSFLMLDSTRMTRNVDFLPSCGFTPLDVVQNGEKQTRREEQDREREGGGISCLVHGF